MNVIGIHRALRSSPVAAAVAGDRGLTMIVVLPLLLLLLAFMTAGLRLTDAGMHFSALQTARQKSFYVADGGLQSAMAKLHEDRLVASRSLTYSFEGAGAVGNDPYRYKIIQDPMFPSDATRKQVIATGEAANSVSNLVSQVQVFGDNPLCDYAIFANNGTAELVNAASVATALLNGNVHSNNELRVRSTVAAGLSGSGRFQSVGDVRSESLAGVLAVMNADLFRGGSFQTSGAHLHAPLTGTPVAGIHFRNGSGNHGVQQVVSRVAFPVADWPGIEQDPAVTIVDRNAVPFGSWDTATNTWIVRGAQILPGSDEIRYFVRGNVHFDTLTLARSADALIAAEGTIEIDQLSLLQTAIGNVLGVGLNSTQTLRLIGDGDVYVGRGLLDAPAVGLIDETRPGLNLAAAVAVNNLIGAYSRNGDVWVKSSAVSALSATRLSLVGNGDATYAATGSLASSPATYCQGI